MKSFYKNDYFSQSDFIYPSALDSPLRCQMGTEEHFSLPYFCQLFLRCQNELKSAQAILASILTFDPPPLTKKLPIWMWTKKCPKPPGQAFSPPLPQTGNVHMEATHFKKGLPLIQCKSYSFSIVWQSKNQSNVCLCPCFVWYSNSCSPFQNSLWLIGLWAII